MSAETEWYPERGTFFWRLERRLWSSWAGSAYQWLRRPNGTLHRFWTKAQAQSHANTLNAGKEQPHE